MYEALWQMVGGGADLKTMPRKTWEWLEQPGDAGQLSRATGGPLCSWAALLEGEGV